MKNYFDSGKKDLQIQNQAPNCRKELAELRGKAGFLGRWEANKRLKEVTQDALVDAEGRSIRAKANTAITTITVVEAAVRASIVSKGMPLIGALGTNLKTATATVQQQLSATCVAELLANQRNSADCINSVMERLNQGFISPDEAKELIDAIQFLTQYDNEQAMKCTGKAKEAVQSLFECGINGIANAKDQIK
ncbi:MAG: hypothetical protein JNK95_12620 [Candidatus Competibacter sp.]|nr:hypothetical protein [Candidatus Competibacter sp.]MDG4606860.1 hypothetical protein [Candidatus Contendobacter sp.]HRD48449.1 hypothetical protein [Candidatus Contendobacter sp.]